MQIKVKQDGARTFVHVIDPQTGGSVSETALEEGQSVTLAVVSANSADDIEVGAVEAASDGESQEPVAGAQDGSGEAQQPETD